MSEADTINVSASTACSKASSRAPTQALRLSSRFRPTLKLPPRPHRGRRSMRDSERYLAQAETVLRMAARAESRAEKDVYLSIAEGWRRLAAEVLRNEPARSSRSPEPREALVRPGR